MIADTDIEVYCQGLWDRLTDGERKNMPIGFRLGVAAVLDDQRKNEQISMADSCNPKKIEERIESIKNNLRDNTLSVLAVETSSICNLSCEFCGAHSKMVGDKRSNKQPLMTYDLFKEVMRKCVEVKQFNVLYLHGNGEPLLNKDIVKMAQFAKYQYIGKIVLVTNGLLLTGNRFMELVEAGVSEFRVSLDIITPEHYKNIKGSEVAYVLNNIKRCICLIKDNFLDVDFKILCADPETASPLYKSEALKIASYFGPMIQGLKNVKVQQRVLYNWVDSVNRCGDDYTRPHPCEMPFYLLMVHTDGDVSMCCADVNKELLVGNINAVENIGEILEADSLRDKRRSLLDGSYRGINLCKNCEVYSVVDAELDKRRDELMEII